jgi:hypothetical protein
MKKRTPAPALHEMVKHLGAARARNLDGGFD